jgi:hypothetical protein
LKKKWKQDEDPEANLVSFMEEWRAEESKSEKK